MLAVAAYNGGLRTSMNGWRRRAPPGRQLTVAEIPFPETRAYVERVLEAQQEYRATYAGSSGCARHSANRPLGPAR